MEFILPCFVSGLVSIGSVVALYRCLRGLVVAAPALYLSSLSMSIVMPLVMSLFIPADETIPVRSPLPEGLVLVASRAFRRV